MIKDFVNLTSLLVIKLIINGIAFGYIFVMNTIAIEFTYVFGLRIVTKEYLIFLIDDCF